MAFTLAKQPKTPLDERIKTIRAEIDEFIDARAAELKTPGIPLVCIRRDLTSRAGDCQCRQYLINTGD